MGLNELLDAYGAPEGTEAYPDQMSVYCDECEITVTADYIVHTGMTKTERLAVARRHLVDYLGWSCADEDLCPACQESPVFDPAIPAQRAEESLGSILPAPHRTPETCSVNDGVSRICGTYPDCACGI
jgi:hypothetical protein